MDIQELISRLLNGPQKGARRAPFWGPPVLQLCQKGPKYPPRHYAEVFVKNNFLKISEM